MQKEHEIFAKTEEYMENLQTVGYTFPDNSKISGRHTSEFLAFRTDVLETRNSGEHLENVIRRHGKMKFKERTSSREASAEISKTSNTCQEGEVNKYRRMPQFYDIPADLDYPDDMQWFDKKRFNYQLFGTWNPKEVKIIRTALKQQVIKVKGINDYISYIKMGFVSPYRFDEIWGGLSVDDVLAYISERQAESVATDVLPNAQVSADAPASVDNTAPKATVPVSAPASVDNTVPKTTVPVYVSASVKKTAYKRTVSKPDPVSAPPVTAKYTQSEPAPTPANTYSAPESKPNSNMPDITAGLAEKIAAKNAEIQKSKERYTSNNTFGDCTFNGYRQDKEKDMGG